jgi:hypothetical protein
VTRENAAVTVTAGIAPGAISIGTTSREAGTSRGEETVGTIESGTVAPRPGLSGGRAMNDGATDAGAIAPTLRAVVVKAIVVHTLTYFVFGLLALLVFDYARLFAETELVHLMRPTTDPVVRAGPLFQPIRGGLFGVLLYALRDAFFGRRRGWLRLWLALVVVGVLGTPGPAPGSLEGMIYTRIPLGVQLRGLPEVLLQTATYSWLLCHWVNHPERRWLSWCLGSAFVVAMLLPAVGLLAGRS